MSSLVSPHRIVTIVRRVIPATSTQRNRYIASEENTLLLLDSSIRDRFESPYKSASLLDPKIRSDVHVRVLTPPVCAVYCRSPNPQFRHALNFNTCPPALVYFLERTRRAVEKPKLRLRVTNRITISPFVYAPVLLPRLN